MLGVPWLMPGWLDPVGGVLVVIPGVVVVVPGVVVLGVVWLPVVPGDVVLVLGCAPVELPAGLPAGAPVVCAAATPSARNKIDAATKFFGMGLLLAHEILPLYGGMRWPLQEMGENESCW
ncbi:MAG TPA: hypothetical protein VI685_16745 [Candidatus Angelobacter sp.]